MSASAKQKFAYSLFDGEFEVLNLTEANINTILAIPRVGDRIRDAGSNVMRIEEVMRCFNTTRFKQQVQTLDDAFKKDDTLASILLKKGTALVKDKDQSLRYFGLALLCAPSNGTQIGEIYAKRGLTFLSLQDSEASLKDITRALSCELPAKLRDMLVVVKERIVRQRSLDVRVDKSENIRRKKYLNEGIFRTYGPENPKIPVASAYIQPKFVEKKGRCVVTTVDLKPGTTVIVEDPYVAMLNNMLKLDTDHCSSCFEREECLIPCPNCMFTMYCCENCRMEDFNRGHKYECPCMPVIQGCDASTTFQLGFRAVCKAGPQELHKIFQGRKKSGSPEVAGTINGFDPETGIYENTYYQISKLICHEDKEDLPYFACLATLLAQTLHHKTDFFKVADELCPGTQLAFINFVAAQILYHASSFRVNSFGLGDISPRKLRPSTALPSSRAKTSWRKSATADCTCTVYAFISLISHSCFPNCLFEYLPNGKMAIVTSREVAAGEEITISYGYFFSIHDVFARRSALFKSYRFCCLCVACSYTFPLYMTETNQIKKQEFLCQLCRRGFSEFAIVRNKKCTLTVSKDRQTLSCKNCKAKTPFRNRLLESSNNEKALRKARQLLKDENPVDAIPILHRCLQFYSSNFCPPLKRMLTAISVFERAMKMLQEKV